MCATVGAKCTRELVFVRNISILALREFVIVFFSSANAIPIASIKEFFQLKLSFAFRKCLLGVSGNREGKVILFFREVHVLFIYARNIFYSSLHVKCRGDREEVALEFI